MLCRFQSMPCLLAECCVCCIVEVQPKVCLNADHQKHGPARAAINRKFDSECLKCLLCGIPLSYQARSQVIEGIVGGSILACSNLVEFRERSVKVHTNTSREFGRLPPIFFKSRDDL